MIAGSPSLRRTRLIVTLTTLLNGPAGLVPGPGQQLLRGDDRAPGGEQQLEHDNALVAQTRGDRLGQLLVIVDNKHAHQPRTSVALHDAGANMMPDVRLRARNERRSRVVTAGGVALPSRTPEPEHRPQVPGRRRGLPRHRLPALVELLYRPLGLFVAGRRPGAGLRRRPGAGIGQLILERAQRGFGDLDLRLELDLAGGGVLGAARRLRAPGGGRVRTRS